MMILIHWEKLSIVTHEGAILVSGTYGEALDDSDPLGKNFHNNSQGSCLDILDLSRSSW